ncbi:Hypothetical protein Cul210932_1250 [Corynebacterium ulcerans]|nr:Hypothetical protein Cul210932_1250 [Corynebacterium ulcerans]
MILIIGGFASLFGLIGVDRAKRLFMLFTYTDIPSWLDQPYLLMFSG